MSKPNLPPDILAKLTLITAKRAKTVIDHLLKYGQITTEELKNVYGYNHPPRAARDVRELGVVLERISVKDTSGRSIAAYRFGEPKLWRLDVLAGRRNFPKDFKNAVARVSGGCRCAICLGNFDSRYLQVDHRVPYQVAGESIGKERRPKDYMLLCGSCNRAKSWSCEHCENYLVRRKAATCLTCYWGQPESYSHVALRTIRRLDLVWTASEVKTFEKIRRLAKNGKIELPQFVKAIIGDYLNPP